MAQTASFWLDLFTWETWNEFLKHGGKVSGFRESRWSTVQKVASGDILLCYLTGVSRFIGALEVVGEPFQDKTPVWHSDVFPARLPVKVTSVYSGLLRMADLIAMQPNINIPLYIVAPDKRREKVLEEINRPTFSRLEPRLNEICRFLPFSTMQELFRKFGSNVRFLKPQILEEISEDCAS
jgi:hypothetical protein